MRSTEDWAKITTEWWKSSEGFMTLDEFIEETLIETETDGGISSGEEQQQRP